MCAEYGEQKDVKMVLETASSVILQVPATVFAWLVGLG